MLRKAILAALTILLVGAVPAAASTARYGHTGSPDRVLRPGCHNYRYHYVVRSPTDDWTLETYLIDPRGEGVGSGMFAADSDPRRGRSHFRICRPTTRPGRFTIRATLHWYGDAEHTVHFERAHFRLRRPS